MRPAQQKIIKSNLDEDMCGVCDSRIWLCTCSDREMTAEPKICMRFVHLWVVSYFRVCCSSSFDFCCCCCFYLTLSHEKDVLAIDKTLNREKFSSKRRRKQKTTVRWTFRLSNGRWMRQCENKNRHFFLSFLNSFSNCQTSFWWCQSVSGNCMTNAS